MKPKVSVIVPVLNRKTLLLRCLDSIHKQTYRPLEVIVVDNGSTDGTLEAAREWGNNHTNKDFEVKVLLEKCPGAAIARNLGLETASGKYSLFFDSDDTMRPELISRAVMEFEKDKNADIICWRCDIHLMNDSIHRSPFNPNDPFVDHLINSLLRTQGYMAPTEKFKEAGGWNEQLIGWDDWELGVRMLLHNQNISGINEVLVDTYAQEVSITGRDFSSKAGSWEKALSVIKNDIEASHHPDKERLLKIVSYRKIILAAHYAKEKNLKLATELKNNTLKEFNESHLTSNLFKIKAQKLLLSFAYHYTRLGGRGAWRIINTFF